MANQQERAELHKTIWKIANDLRGSVDGWEFKAYVLGSIFYRFISENICDYIRSLMAEIGQPDFDYAAMSDNEAENIRRKMVQEKGYFILPSQLFQNIVKTCDRDENLNEHLSSIFRSIEASAIGTDSEDDLRGLFSDFSVDDTKLGSTVIKRNQLLAKVLKTVSTMDLGSRYDDTQNDTFGDTYEFLMQMYASEAGKSGGEFFTPQQVSELLARLASWHNPGIQKVYDPACGSGSLLLKFAKTIGKENEHLKYYGQEVNPTTYNLCRINMFLHNVNFDNFDIRLEDTLLRPILAQMGRQGEPHPDERPTLCPSRRACAQERSQPGLHHAHALAPEREGHSSHRRVPRCALQRWGREEDSSVSHKEQLCGYRHSVASQPLLWRRHSHLHHRAEEERQDGLESALHRRQQTLRQERQQEHAPARTSGQDNAALPKQEGRAISGKVGFE